MKLSSAPLALAIFVLLFGGISFTSAMNWWQTESKKEPVRYSTGEAAGEYNPADIRGSYTFGEVSDLFDVPLADLQIAFRLPAEGDPANFSLKTLETANEGLDVEIGTGSVRMFVALYKGLPFDLEAAEETFLFAEAVDLIKLQGKVAPEQLAYLEAHMVTESTEPAAETTLVASENVVEPAATEHAPEEYLITGKTSFQDVLNWGVPPETIESILADKMPAPQLLVKDYASSKGKPFSELKTKLQEEVDKYK